MKPNHSNSDVCTMPDHGLETAAAECCRPSSPHFRGARPVRASASSAPLAFWRDRAAWAKASRNTLNCLIGCSIGDFAVIIYMQAYHPHAPMLLTMGLAMAAGLATSIIFESAMLRFKEGFAWRNAVTMAFSMSFLSMLGMEFAANLTDYLLTGGKVAMHQPFYWTALGISLVAGFLAPLPYNYWKFKKHGQACH
jgi:hypothetical protein